MSDTIQFANGNLIVHQYDALGNKYSTTYYTRNSPIVVPVGNVVEQLGSEYNKQHYVYNDNVTYRKLTNTLWRIERVENAEGYIGYNIQQNSYLPYYYIKDYLGNVRETYMGLTNTTFQCVQQIQYYPSGLPWNDNYQTSQQPYKYGSKEFVEMHGLDEYDSEARWYYPALMRTTTQDPLAEKYYDISPYAWCANNPVNLVDPDGRKIVVNEGDEGYKKEVEEQLEKLQEMSTELHDAISILEESEITYKINYSNKKNQYALNDKTIYYNRTLDYIEVELEEGKKIKMFREPIIGLAHELGHAYDHEIGFLFENKNNFYQQNESLYYHIIIMSEITSLKFENMVRQALTKKDGKNRDLRLLYFWWKGVFTTKNFNDWLKKNNYYE